MTLPSPKVPHISVNDLALFMVSSDTARSGIIRRAKVPQKPPIIRYRDVRGPVCEYLTNVSRGVNPLISAEAMFEQRMGDPSFSALMQDDARNSIEVIHGIQRMQNQLGQYDFRKAPERQPKLTIEGLKISIRADLLVAGTNRKGDELVGAGILRMTQSGEKSDGAISKRREMGLYVATLAKVHVDQNLAGNSLAANSLCMSIDVQHGEVFTAPTSITRRINDLSNACRFIVALWPTV